MQDAVIFGSCMLGLGFSLGIIFEGRHLKERLKEAGEHFQHYAKAMIDAAFVLQQENDQLREKLKQYEAETPQH